MAIDNIERIAVHETQRRLPLCKQASKRLVNNQIDNLHGRRPTGIIVSFTDHSCGISHIHCLLVGREAKAIRLDKPIRHGSDIARLRIVAIDLIGQLGPRADMLLVAILRVRKPDGAICMDDNVIDAIEPTAVVISDDGFHLVGALWGHVSQAAAGG